MDVQVISPILICKATSLEEIDKRPGKGLGLGISLFRILEDKMEQTNEAENDPVSKIGRKREKSVCEAK